MRLENETLVRRFLLGELAEEERARVEDAFLVDEEAFEMLLAAEDELVDAYARGELRGRERERFERHFLSTPRGREKLLRTRSLLEVIRQEPAAPPAETARAAWWQTFIEGLRGLQAPLRYGLAGALLVFLLGGVWLLTRRGEQPRQSREAAVAVRPEATRGSEVAQVPNQEQPHEAPTAGGPEAGAAESRPAPSPSKRTDAPRQRSVSVASLTLTPGLTRESSASARTLRIAPGSTRARLTLELDQADYASYRAALVTATGRRVWSGDRLRKSASGSALVLTLPAALLAEGDYVLELSGAAPSGGFESVADYSFRVLRK